MLPFSTSKGTIEMIPYNPRQTLISLHIPKCAGQSLRTVLSNWFGDKFHTHYYQKRNDLPLRLTPEPGMCIHGHFNRSKGFGAMEYYPDIKQYITVIRDPLELLISNYFFWKTKARARQIRLGSLRPGSEHDYRDIEDFAQKRPKSVFQDFMPFELTLDDYRRLLETHFIWIGMVEKLQFSVDRLADSLGFNRVQIPKLNVSKRDEYLSEASKEIFMSNNRLEFEIFTYIKSTYYEE
jgi:hypothetical protein